MIAEAARFTCPRCGLQLVLTTPPPQFGDLKCDDCGGTIELHPSTAQASPIHFAGAKEIDAGAVKIRELVNRMRDRNENE